MEYAHRVLDVNTIEDGKTLLEAFKLVLEGNVRPFYNGREVYLDDILNDISKPELGFKEDMLPKQFKSVCKRNGEVVLTYKLGEFNHAYDKKYWTNRGYWVRWALGDDSEIEIRDSRQQTLARVGKNALHIQERRLEEFMNNMQ